MGVHVQAEDVGGQLLLQPFDFVEELYAGATVLIGGLQDPDVAA